MKIPKNIKNWSKILVNHSTRKLVSLRYALLRITLPSKPPSNRYAISGLENSETIKPTYFILVVAYKKMHRF